MSCDDDSHGVDVLVVVVIYNSGAGGAATVAANINYHTDSDTNNDES